MKLSKAVEILLGQKAKLKTENLRQDTWKTQTASYIEGFFGEKSNEYTFIERFEFYSKTFDSMSASYDTDYHIKQNTRTASDFIDNCVDTLKTKGLYRAPKQNFIAQLSETAIWAIVGLGIPGLLSVGFFFGNLFSDKQNIELRQENRNVRDSLHVLRFSRKSTGSTPGSRTRKIDSSSKTDK
jgi:hypothetical protein